MTLGSVQIDPAGTGSRVRVWVVDDQPTFRLATVATLSVSDEFVMAGAFDSGESAIEHIPDGCAGLVLMDIHMPGMGGIEAARQLSARHPDLLVVLTSTYRFEDLPSAVAHCGAVAYLHKERLSPDLLARLWQAAG